MSTAVDQIRDKITTVERALRTSGTDTPFLSHRVEAAGIEESHRAILDCLKALAAAVQDIEKRIA